MQEHVHEQDREENQEGRQGTGRREILTTALYAIIGIFFTAGTARFALFSTGEKTERRLNRQVLEDLKSGVPIHIPEAHAWLIKDEAHNIAALDDRCPHLGCRHNWDAGKGIFVCPCHGSEFDVAGAVIKGPSVKPLTVLKIVDEKDVVLLK